ncbi:hypothetical protein PROFUN_13460 [Planoprotostelium fungivorum]|uniref:Uncharacterized protein n=1 Tax=Planoprotostelium fungivorum TaxID=1890364 RepID=A0A2P6N400_9EUKA|nr:hypothetical protein PROFUN_13460 [Planoprotostelium fungivorum]
MTSKILGESHLNEIEILTADAQTTTNITHHDKKTTVKTEIRRSESLDLSNFINESNANVKIPKPTLEAIETYRNRSVVEINQKLQETDHELSRDQVIGSATCILALAGLIGGYLYQEPLYWFVTGVLLVVLFLHNLQGWSPLVFLFVGSRVRSERDIYAYREGLKIARGDFDLLFNTGSMNPATSTNAALRKAAGRE